MGYWVPYASGSVRESEFAFPRYSAPERKLQGLSITHLPFFPFLLLWEKPFWILDQWIEKLNIPTLSSSSCPSLPIFAWRKESLLLLLLLSLPGSSGKSFRRQNEKESRQGRMNSAMFFFNYFEPFSFIFYRQNLFVKNN